MLASVRAWVARVTTWSLTAGGKAPRITQRRMQAQTASVAKFAYSPPYHHAKNLWSNLFQKKKKKPVISNKKYCNIPTLLLNLSFFFNRLEAVLFESIKINYVDTSMYLDQNYSRDQIEVALPFSVVICESLNHTKILRAHIEEIQQ
jgi:hypothetical protein